MIQRMAPIPSRCGADFKLQLKDDASPNTSSSDKPIVKKVAFEDGLQTAMETNGYKKEKEAVLRFPNIGHESNYHKNDFSGLYNKRGTEKHLSKKSLRRTPNTH